MSNAVWIAMGAWAVTRILLAAFADMPITSVTPALGMVWFLLVAGLDRMCTR